MLYQVDFASGPRVAGEEPWRELYEGAIPDISGKPVNDQGFVPQIKCINPGNHRAGDTHASAYVNLISGVYGCSVCGNYSPFRFMVEILGYDVADAATTISEYKNTTKFPKEDNFVKATINPPAELTHWAFEAAARLDPELPIVRDYMQARGLSFTTLLDYHVGYVPEGLTQGQIECLSFPYFYNGRVVAIRGRAADGRKGGVKNSRYVPFSADNTSLTAGVLLEGESDCLRAHEVFQKHGVPMAAVGVPGAIFKAEWQRELAHLETIYVVPQADQPSRLFAKAAQEILGKRARVVELPWSRGQNGKDLCDWLLLNPEHNFIRLLPPVPKKRGVIKHNEMLEIAEQEYPWIVPGLLAEGDKVLVGGQQKSFKTWLMLFMVKALCEGQNFLGRMEWPVTKPRRVLFVEEEGNIISLAKRAKKVIGEISEDNLFWMHKQTVRLDDAVSYNNLINEIERFAPHVLILDPLQRMHSKVEDNSWEMGEVWDAIHNLTVRFPRMAVIIVHHFKKGDADVGWDSFRGSSRSAGEADLGLMIKRDRNATTLTEAVVTMTIDGRDIPAVSAGEGKLNEIRIFINTEKWTIESGDLRVIDAAEDAKIRSIENQIVQFIMKSGSKSVKELSEQFGIVDHKLNRIMRDLANQGALVREKETSSDNANGWRYVYKIKENIIDG
jgi:hypothetical protein